MQSFENYKKLEGFDFQMILSDTVELNLKSINLSIEKVDVDEDEDFVDLSESMDILI